MDYYRRYRQDGSCEIICVSCFTTIGIAENSSMARGLEAEHSCHQKAGEKPSPPLPPTLHLPSAIMNAEKATPPWPSLALGWEPQFFGIAMVVIFLYFLPTAIERIAMDHANIWVSCILPGDLAGCLYLATALNKPRFAISLYLLLTILEGYLYIHHLLPARALFWVVDIVPTLVVAGLLVRGKGATGSRTVAVS
jgi:hypothetical protein